MLLAACAFDNWFIILCSVQRTPSASKRPTSGNQAIVQQLGQPTPSPMPDPQQKEEYCIGTTKHLRAVTGRVTSLVLPGPGLDGSYGRGPHGGRKARDATLSPRSRPVGVALRFAACDLRPASSGRGSRSAVRGQGRRQGKDQTATLLNRSWAGWS